MRRTVPAAAVLLLVLIGMGAFLVLRPGGSPSRESPEARGFMEQRREMIETQLAARDVKDPRVLAAMRTVPRHEFVGEEGEVVAVGRSRRGV
jgi:hypothetical protein